LEISVLDALQVQEWVLVGVPLQNFAEKWAARGQDHFVRLQLLVLLTDERNVQEIFGVSYVSECMADIRLKVVPLETKFLRPHLDGRVVFLLGFTSNKIFVKLPAQKKVEFSS